jgi:hypothetical protein
MSSHAESDPLAARRSTGWLLIAAGAVSIDAGLLAIAYTDLTLLALALFAGINLILLSALTLADAFAKGADGAAHAGRDPAVRRGGGRPSAQVDAGLWALGAGRAGLDEGAVLLRNDILATDGVG